MNTPHPMQHFWSKFWNEFFRSSSHLDAILSRLDPEVKSHAATISSLILRRPATLARHFKIGTSIQFNPTDTHVLNQLSLLLGDALETGTELPKSGEQLDFPEVMRSELTPDLAKTLSSDPPLTLRLRKPAPAGFDSWTEYFRRELGTPGTAGTLAARAHSFDSYQPVLSLPAFLDGSYEIQDEGSQVMASFLLWPELYSKLLTQAPGPSTADGQSMQRPKIPSKTTWIDACAGAGGKTLALSDALGGHAKIFAYDRSDRKIQSLRKRVSRAQANNIKAQAIPENDPLSALKPFLHKADGVLVDAPCSGWGVLRRNPDMKWKQTTSEISDLPALQLSLLKTYSELVKPGGRVVYGTCTYRKDETTAVVEAFINQSNGKWRLGRAGYLGPGPTDGFFMASFIENSLD